VARNRLALTVGALGVTVIAVAAGVGWWVLRDDGASKKTAAKSSSSSPRDSAQAPAPTSPPCDTASVIASWPLEQRVAQLLMVGVDPRSGHEASDIVARYGVGGGFIGGDATGIFRDDSRGRLSSPAAIPALVAVDEEGGRVQRIDQLAGSLPSARVMAQTSVS
jgi:beta-N-acetylhexosaminidase